MAILVKENGILQSVGVFVKDNNTASRVVLHDIPYTISIAITNGTYSGDTKIIYGMIASGTLSADNGYALPNSITVVGAEYTYDKTSGALTISNPIGDVSVTCVCEEGIKYIQFDNVINASSSASGNFSFSSNGETFSSMSIVHTSSHSD